MNNSIRSETKFHCNKNCLHYQNLLEKEFITLYDGNEVFREKFRVTFI
jgi:hypothetical protein